MRPLAWSWEKGPHDRLHVGAVHGLVVVAEVDPSCLAGHRLLPLGRVAHDRGPAEVVEPADAVLHDRLASRHAQLLLRLHLGREAMTVPAEPPVDPAPPHGVVAGHDVLDVAREEVPVVGEAVGEGGDRRRRRTGARPRLARADGPARPGTCPPRPTGPGSTPRWRGSRAWSGRRDRGCHQRTEP